MTSFTVLSGLALAYMLPTVVAFGRTKSNAKAIGLLNLLVGWTGVGWLVALVMACSVEASRQVVAYALPPGAAAPGWYAHPEGGERYWAGAAWTDWWR